MLGKRWKEAYEEMREQKLLSTVSVPFPIAISLVIHKDAYTAG